MEQRKSQSEHERLTRLVLEAVERIDRKVDKIGDEMAEQTGKLSATHELLSENKSELRDIRNRLFTDPDGIQGRLSRLDQKFGQHVLDDSKMQKFLLVGFGLILSIQLEEQLKWVDRLLSVVTTIAIKLPSSGNISVFWPR